MCRAKASQADALVVHTMEVQRALNATLLTLGGAESGLRGFLLTGNEAFLRPHREAGELLPQQLAELRQLVADNPTQLANRRSDCAVDRTAARQHRPGAGRAARGPSCGCDRRASTFRPADLE